MSRFLGVALTTGLALSLFAGAASAQAPPYMYNQGVTGFGNRALISPYLSLVNGGNPGINYFTQTLPELDRRATQQYYNSAIRSLEVRALAPPNPGSADADLFTPLPTTGHPSAFQYTGGYFPAGPGRRPAPAYQSQAIRR